MTKIDPSMYLNNQSKTREPSTELGKDDFLKILMTQLQNQDPTDPMDDSESVSQMAAFSSLEQMTNMSESMERLADSKLSPVVQYSNMIGQEVAYQEDDGEEPSVETSKVTAVSQKDDQAKLELENGKRIDAGSIIKIYNPAQDVPDDTATNNVVESGAEAGNN